MGRRQVLSVPGRLEVVVESVELPDGRLVDDYYQIHTNDYAVVVTETADSRILFLRQYRHGARRFGLEMVAGGIHSGEAPLAAAQRELLEETGYVSPSWHSLGSYAVSSAHGIAMAHLFCARDAIRQQDPDSGDLETATIEILSREQAMAALTTNELLGASHVAALALALLKRPTDE